MIALNPDVAHCGAATLVAACQQAGVALRRPLEISDAYFAETRLVRRDRRAAGCRHTSYRDITRYVTGVRRRIFNLVRHAFPSRRPISPANSRLAGLALFRNRLGWRTREVRG